MNIFDALDQIIDLPLSVFEKKLAKFEHDFSQLDIDDIAEEALDEYFLRIRNELSVSHSERAQVRLRLLGYLSPFDTLVEKYFPDYAALLETVLKREDALDLSPSIVDFVEHMKEILRDYTHRLSEPDRYPSYTNYIQELVQTTMIDLFFWLQDEEERVAKKAPTSDRHSSLALVMSDETHAPYLRLIRQILEILGEGVLEKIFFDLGYPTRPSPEHEDLLFIGRYERKEPIIHK